MCLRSTARLACHPIIQYSVHFTGEERFELFKIYYVVFILISLREQCYLHLWWYFFLLALPLLSSRWRWYDNWHETIDNKLVFCWKWKWEALISLHLSMKRQRLRFMGNFKVFQKQNINKKIVSFMVLKSVSEYIQS